MNALNNEAVAVRPRFGSMKIWCAVSGQSRSRAYEWLAAGRLRGVKDGAKLHIDIDAGLAEMEKLPSFETKQAA